ncbi:superoxide dismutase [Paenibacillus mesophilus]|uniref:superoxide dismutase family protein n=1 Tax=Paenibacillus mesophilus TaxID=2582849 RepID=UPI00110F62B2|nr:superoxide dismutase family protein [Paenibacillus mesophilus]TMV47302.1 superoxide dismutase [Paenibacillus mesophilus]
MKRIPSSFKWGVSGFLCGAVFFAGLAQAASPMTQIEASLDSLKFFVNGQSKPSQSILYNGSTYVPLRQATELTGQNIYWDEKAGAVSIGKPSVVIYDATGKEIGIATLTPYSGGVTIEIEVSGLAPGKHGFHIHEKAFEGNDFKTAGGHFNPDGKKHGHDHREGHHLGDLDNLMANAEGKASLKANIEGATLDKDSGKSLLGRSVIIHAAEDDGITDPAGNSGDRIAGGVIPQ